MHFWWVKDACEFNKQLKLGKKSFFLINKNIFASQIYEQNISNRDFFLQAALRERAERCYISNDP